MYRSKNKEAYYLRSTLFIRIASDNTSKIGPSTSCRIYWQHKNNQAQPRVMSSQYKKIEYWASIKIDKQLVRSTSKKQIQQFFYKLIQGSFL